MIGGRVRSATLGMAVMAVAAGSAQAARLEYMFDLGVEQNDNLSLSSTEPLDDTIYRPSVGFALSEDAERLRADFAGRVEYRHYADGTYDNGFVGELSGRGDWLAIPGRLTFTVEDSLAQEAIDSFEADSPDNRQQVNAFAIGPTVDFRMGDALDGQIELRYVDTDAEVTDEFNSSRIDLTLRSIRKIDETSQLAFNLRGQNVDFDDEITGRNYRRGDFYASYDKHLNRLDLQLDAGYSHIGYTDGLDSRSEPLLRADLTWIFDDSNRLAVQMARQFSDAATDTMVRLEEDAVVPGSILTGDTVINASPFIERRASLDYSFTSALFTASLELYAHELDYVESDEFDQKGYGARGTLLYVINSRTMVGVFGALDNTEYLQLGREEEIRLGREEEIRRYGLNLSRSFSTHWSARLEYLRYERDTSVLGDDANQNSIFLVFRYTR